MNPTDATLRSLFSTIRGIAVVGAKDAPGQPVEYVSRYMMRAGYTVIPVHPVHKRVWGLPACVSLADLPEPVNMVNLFRASQYCPDHAREVLALPGKPRVFWMQLGVSSPEATTMLENEGIVVVQDRCLMLEHQRIMGAV